MLWLDYLLHPMYIVRKAEVMGRLECVYGQFDVRRREKQNEGVMCVHGLDARESKQERQESQRQRSKEGLGGPSGGKKSRDDLERVVEHAGEMKVPDRAPSLADV